jgi:hypothetical protein
MNQKSLRLAEVSMLFDKMKKRKLRLWRYRKKAYIENNGNFVLKIIGILC